MKAFFAILMALFSVGAWAQGGQTYAATTYKASDYGTWQITSQFANTFLFQPNEICDIPQPSGGKFQPFNTNAPVFIRDADTASWEVVTPHTVIENVATCGIIITPTYPHYSFRLLSGTGGLQEVLNQIPADASYPVPVILDRNWYAGLSVIPGVTPNGVITAAHGSTAAFLVDITTAPYTWYTYQGGHYAAVSISGSIDYVAPWTGGVTQTSTQKWSQSLSIKDFGAVCDGAHTTQDTAALQYAVAAANIAGMAVYVPAGNCTLNNSSTPVISGANNVLIWGDGFSSSLTCETIGGPDCIASTGATGFGLQDISVSFGPSANTRSSGYAVDIETCTNCLLNNVKLNNGDLSGLRLASSQHTTITNLKATNFEANGTFLINDQDLTVSGLSCVSNGDACFETSWYDSEYGAHSVPCDGISATNINSNLDTAAILINACTNVTVNGFTSAGEAKEGVWIGQDPTTTTTHWPDRVTITGGSIWGPGYGSNPLNTATAPAIILNVGTNPAGFVSHVSLSNIIATHVSSWGLEMAELNDVDLKVNGLQFYDVGNNNNAGCLQTEGNQVDLSSIMCSDMGTYGLYVTNTNALTGADLTFNGANQLSGGFGGNALYLSSTATGTVQITGVNIKDTNASTYSSSVFDGSPGGQHRIWGIYSQGLTTPTGPTSANSSTTYAYADPNHSYVVRNGGQILSFAPPNLYLLPTGGTTSGSQVNGAVFYWQSKCRATPISSEQTESVGWYDWYPTLTTESFAFTHTGGCGFPIILDLTAASAVDSPALNAQSVASGNINGDLYPAQCANTPSPSWCSGTTADAWIRAACTAQSAGGNVRLTGLTGTIAASVTCSTSSKHIDLYADNSTNLTITESDGGIAFPIDNTSSFTGPGYGQCLNGAGIHLSSSANVTAVVGPAHTDGSQENFAARGLCIYGATGATVSKGLIYGKANYVNTTIANNNLGVCNNACIWLENMGGSIEVYNDEMNVTDGAYGVDGSGIVIASTGSGTGCISNSIHIHGGNAEHANGGSSYSDIQILGNGAGALACSIHIDDMYTERNLSGTPETNSISITDCWGCSVRDIQGGGGNGSAGALIYVAQSASGRVEDLEIDHINSIFQPYANTINDTVQSVQIASSTYPYIASYPVNPGYVQPPALPGTVIQSVTGDVMNGDGNFSTGSGTIGTNFGVTGCNVSVACTLTRDNSTAPPGSTYSQKIQITANADSSGGYNGVQWTPTVSFVAGTNYSVTFWGKGDGTFPGFPTFLLWNSSTPVFYCTDSTITPFSTTWTLYAFTCTPSVSGTAYIAVAARTPTLSTGTFWLGNFIFAPVAQLSPGNLLTSVTPYGIGPASDAQKTITINSTPCELGGTCSISGGGGTAFSGLTSGTNTSAAMLLGSGASLGATGSGTNTATAMPWSGLSGSPSTAQVPVQSLTTTGTSGAATLSGGVLNVPQYTGGSGTTFQANGTGLSSSSTVNFENGAATNGLTLTFANPSAGNVQLGFTGTLTNAGLANSGTTVNSQTCTLGSSCTIPFQTNSSNNTSQAGLNMLTSTANSVGLTVTPTNSATNQEKFEVTGSSYTGNAATATTATQATNLAGTGTDYAPYQSASATTSYITAPTTSGDTFVYAWQPSGSAVAPAAVNLGALPANLPTSSVVDTTTSQTLTNKTLDGVTPTIMGYLDATSSIQTQLNGKAATNANTTGTAGNGVATYTLSGATPTAVVSSASIPAEDQNYLPLTANVTSFPLPASSAVANGEILRITVQQGASTAYTLPTGTANSPFTAGSGTTLINAVPTGCPTIGTTTGSVTPSEIFYILQYHSALTEWEILGCNTTVAQTGVIEAPIQASGTFGGAALNTVVATISPTHSGHIVNLVIVNTNASSNCTTAPTFNVFDGTSNTGTAKIGITTAQTKGNATSQSQSLAFNAGDIIGIYISTAGATCTVPVWSVSAMITEP